MEKIYKDANGHLYTIKEYNGSDKTKDGLWVIRIRYAFRWVNHKTLGRWMTHAAASAMLEGVAKANGWQDVTSEHKEQPKNNWRFQLHQPEWLKEQKQK